VIRVSAGTAQVIGLKETRNDAPPTTAYLMAGEKCRSDCAFCPQGRSSRARTDLLSRITWPEFDAGQVAAGVACAYDNHLLGRACLQVTNSGESLDRARDMVKKLKEESDVPICVSCSLARAEAVLELADLGADRVGLALDAACERVYQSCKSGSWSRTLALIEEAARLLPGRISTHLIAGLGETEAEMVRMIQHLADLGVTVGLFAFTPVRGTKLAALPPPPLDSYRRIQAARYLIAEKLASVDRFTFAAGVIAAYGLSREKLRAALAGGDAFRTSGCPDCNRPYYNEKPGGVIYNYPRPLSEAEVQEAFALLGI
jgi:biotin synthase-related radical SAM superfamily protein